MDIEIENHGSIVLFRALSGAARDFFNLHMPADVPVFDGAYAVEQNYAGAVVDAASFDGLAISH